MKKHLSTQNGLAIFLLLILGLIQFIPLTGYADTAIITQDGRWWSNAYFDFSQTFPHLSDITTAGFNHSGLAFNLFYPVIPLRLIQLPLVLLHVTNPYIMNAVVMYVTDIIMFTAMYKISQALNIKYPLLIATTLLYIQLTPSSGAVSNSLPQLLSLSFTYWGVYGIISRRYSVLVYTTVLLLTTSFTTSLVAFTVFLIVAGLERMPIDEWIQIGVHGGIGFMLSLPIIAPIIQLTKFVNKPTNAFESFDAPWTIIGRVMRGEIGTYEPYLIRLIVVMFIMIMFAITFTKISKPVIPLAITALLIINGSPKISGVLSSPIQPGTWFRMWIYVVIITAYALKDFNIEKYYLALLIVLVPITALIMFSIHPDTKPHNFKDSDISVAIKHKKWHDFYDDIQNNLELYTQNKFGINIKPDPKNLAYYSMDYTPINARVKDNQLIYTSAKKYKAKYGVTKHIASDKQTIVVNIKPKAKITPLAVWHYDFINYDIKTTSGKVVANSHDMFEYHGTKKATILISEKQ